MFDATILTTCMYILQDVIRIIGEVPSDPNTAIPKHKIIITDCGMNDLDRKYDLTEEQIDSNEDL